MLPEPPVLQWLFASWLWLSREARVRAEGILVTPTRLCMPPPPVRGHGRARVYFARVCAAAGVPHEPFVLVAEGSEEGSLRGLLPVPFSEWALDDPGITIAQMATGVGHHVVGREESAPDDPQTLEMTAELCAVYLGFGVFLANLASRVINHPALQIPGLGRVVGSTLDERELSYALAIWAWMNEVADDEVIRWLMPNPQAFYAFATKDLRRRGRELEALRAASDEHHEGPYR